MLHHHPDDQEVGNLGQREKRRIEQRDHEEARRAHRQRERLDPVDEIPSYNKRMIIQSRRNAPVVAIAAAAALAGAIVALHYHRLGLTLSHYDARGHLVVARRIADSITPGWQQVGAVWLPLPHLLNFLPAQVDWLYRTGAAAVAISIASFAVAAGAIAWIVLVLTGSVAAALLGSAVFVVNPNVLYLQATPMTEPLLLALTLVAVALLVDGQLRPALRRDGGCAQAQAADADTAGRTIRPATVGWAFALACMTRYEAWPVTICALLAAVWAWWRSGVALADAVRRAGGIARYPAIAVAAFALYSRVVVGEWFTTGGFFVPENKALDRPFLAAAEIWWGAHALSGSLTIALAAVGLCALLVAAALYRNRAAWLIPLSLLATAAVPWAAFVKGHPFRIRYMVPLIAAEAIGVGIAVGARQTCGAGGGARRRGRARVRRSAAGSVRTDGPRSAMGRAQRARAGTGHRLPACEVRRRHDHGEHGLARPLHAGSLAPRLRPARFPARGEWRHLARGAQRPAAVRGLAADRGEGGGRRHAGRHRAPAPGLSRRLRARLLGSRPGAVPAHRGGTAAMKALTLDIRRDGESVTLANSQIHLKRSPN